MQFRLMCPVLVKMVPALQWKIKLGVQNCQLQHKIIDCYSWVLKLRPDIHTHSPLDTSLA